MQLISYTDAYLYIDDSDEYANDMSCEIQAHSRAAILCFKDGQRTEVIF